MTKIREGDEAPDVTLDLHGGERLRLRDRRGRGAVVLYFYPRDDTPICTREACGFRDAFADFAGAEVIGVSADSAESHREFAARHQLPFQLAADPDGAVARAFGVEKRFGLLPARVTFVIDRDGIVRRIIDAPFSARSHVDGALAAL